MMVVSVILVEWTLRWTTIQPVLSVFGSKLGAYFMVRKLFLKVPREEWKMKFAWKKGYVWDWSEHRWIQVLVSSSRPVPRLWKAPEVSAVYGLVAVTYNYGHKLRVLTIPHTLALIHRENQGLELLKWSVLLRNVWSGLWVFNSLTLSTCDQKRFNGSCSHSPLRMVCLLIFFQLETSIGLPETLVWWLPCEWFWTFSISTGLKRLRKARRVHT